MKLQELSEIRYLALIHPSKNGKYSVQKITLIEPSKEILENRDGYEKIARKLAEKFIEISDNGGLFLSSTMKNMRGGWSLEMESLEFIPGEEIPEGGPLTYNILFRLNRYEQFSEKRLRQTIHALRKKTLNLEREIRKKDDLLEQLETIKESFRIPFDAINDLMISFDCKGNVLVINEASLKWFGLSPRDIVKKKCKALLNQQIFEVVKRVCETGNSETVEESVKDRMLRITYIPMTNKKNGKTEVVMLAQDITEHKIHEERKIKDGRDEAVTVMGGTVKHILSSSLTAILGFSQLALSEYDWPRDTMVKYLKLIERTAKRMNMEISKLSEQKEYRTTKYIEVPGAEAKEIIEIDVNYDPDETIG